MTIAIAMRAAKAPRTAAALTIVVAVGAMAVLAFRILHGIALPLWLDETWTAMIASRPTWGAFWREAWLDCNPPLYYLVMHLWQGLAGQSDWAWRAPSLAFMAAAAALPLVWTAPGLTKAAALTWGALIWFWWPGLASSLDARAYSLVLLLCTAQTIAFAGLMQAPALRRAAVWCGLGSLAILTHYYAVYIGAAQGLMYLAIHRKRAVKTWPAALLFLPAFGWLAGHLPRIAEYARPDVAWYPPLDWKDLRACLTFIVGRSKPLFLSALLLVLAGGYLAARRVGSAEPDEAPAARHLWWAAASGLIAFALCVAVAIAKPSLAPRYTTVMVPAALLLLVLAAGLSRRAHLSYALLATLFLTAALSPNELGKRLRVRSTYGFERESSFLMQANPTQVVFAWDHPAAKVLDRGSLAKLGGYFFERRGMEVEVAPVILDPREDPNRRLLSEADGERPVLLWLYNRERTSAAGNFPQQISAVNPDFVCIENAVHNRGIVACAPRRLFVMTP